ncbi:MAG: type II toxin-antitoxin system RelE/ParE family toxin [Ahniella sp.]|nr:type II toxin-antitoxin system RelE/ParE family toxin [Ahniella sp.]
MAEIRLSPAALADIEGIFDFRATTWGLAQAIEYSKAIEDTLVALLAHPESAANCSHIRTGYRRALAGRHFVYFRIESYGIAVIRILHPRMDATSHL